MQQVFLFESTHAVIKAERILTSAEIKHKIIPVPRQISSECGMAIEVGSDLVRRAQDELTKAALPFELHTVA